MGYPKGSALFQISNPALFSMAIAFGGIWLFSKLDTSARGAAGQGWLRRPICAFADRHRRLRRLGSLTKNRGAV